MVFENPKETPLNPDRHPQRELFVCDVADVVLKDDMATMEHPFFSLSKKPETAIRRYENGEKWLEVLPSAKGLATIWDKDVLIYCISQMIHKANEGESLTRHVRIVAHDLLIFANRKTGGGDYEALKDALDRLDGTRIRTNIETGDIEQYEGFGLIEAFKIKRSKTTGRVLEMGVTLSEWVFNAIEAQEVLTLSPAYFRLKKAIDRRVYEIARKHCGKQKSWKISLPLLKNKCGSRAPLKGFRHAIKAMSQINHLPDYLVSFDEARDMVEFSSREAVAAVLDDQVGWPRLSADTYHDARQLAPGWDISELEQQWVSWWADMGKPDLKNPDAAFLGFCRRKGSHQKLA
jgi:plasmid replication initiation protein